MNEILNLLDSLSTRLLGHITVRSHDIGLEIRVHWRKPYGSYGRYFSRNEIKRARSEIIVNSFISAAKEAQNDLKRKQLMDKRRKS